MVNIHDTFVLDSRVLGGADDPRFRCVERTTCFDTGRLRIRLRRRKAKPQRRRKSQTRPTAEATVLKANVSSDLRSVSVAFEDHGKQRTKTYRTQSLHAPIAKLHATAKAIRHLDARRVAIQASGVASMLVQLNTPRSNKPGLGPALGLLATRTWKRKGDWLVGTLRAPQSTSKL